MKYIILCAGFLFCCVAAHPQQREKLKKDKFNSHKFSSFEITANSKWFENLDINFSGTYSFIDARADKSKLGFIMSGDDNSYHNFVFPKETEAYLNNAISKLGQVNKEDQKILIVIRSLWLSQLMIPAGLLKKIALGDPKGYLSYCNLKCDFYLQQSDQVRYIGSTDSAFREHRWIGNAYKDILSDALTTAIWIGDSLTIHAAKNIRPFPLRSLMDTITDQYHFPILTAVKPQRGVYRNYNDFINNAPLVADIELVRKHGKEFLQSTGLDTATTNRAWGYSDGEDIYKHINDGYYRMVRVQNTFELVAPRVIRDYYIPFDYAVFVTLYDLAFLGIAGLGTDIWAYFSEKSIIDELVPYQMEISTGNIR